MGDVKWIKIYTSIISNKKIKRIRRMPEGNNIILIWLFLLAQAGVCNKEGGLLITDTIPFNVDDLAEEFKFSTEVIRLALITFEKFSMIEIYDDVIYIKNWSEYQNIDGMEKIREQNRKRVAEHRARKKQLLISESNEGCNVTSNDTVTEGNATEEEEEIEKEIDIDIEEDIDKEKISWKNLLIAYNDLPLKSIRTITDKRKSKVKARINSLGITYNDILQTFSNIKLSKFLLGQNNRGWIVDFDWLFENDNNFTKVLEGKYTDKEVNNGCTRTNTGKSEGKFSGFKAKQSRVELTDDERKAAEEIL